MLNSSRELKIPILLLPSEYRLDLSLPQGKLYVHKTRGVIKGLKSDVTVGDIVSERHYSKLKIIDYKTKRVHSTQLNTVCDQIVVNPPGGVSINSTTILDALREGYICVNGEEDLLVIPLLKKTGVKIIYGQPDIGVVEVEGSLERAIKVLKILIPHWHNYG